MDVTSDPNNCGGCGNTCDPGIPCTEGVCTCPAGESKKCRMLSKIDRPCWEFEWCQGHEQRMKLGPWRKGPGASAISRLPLI